MQRPRRGLKSSTNKFFNSFQNFLLITGSSHKLTEGINTSSVNVEIIDWFCPGAAMKWWRLFRIQSALKSFLFLSFVHLVSRDSSFDSEASSSQQRADSNLNVELKKSNLYCTCGITPKCIARGRAHLRGLAPGPHSSWKKRLSGGEPLATLCPILPTRESSLKHVPIALS